METNSIVMKTRSLVLFCAALLAISAGVSAENLTVLATFPGDSGPGPKDKPDNTGGVGPSHVVDFTDARIVVHDKATGKVLQKMDQRDFWKTVQPGFDQPFFNDPRMLFDAVSGRWICVIACAIQDASGKRMQEESGYLAVSETFDPTKGWRGVKLPMKPADLGMKLGVDKNGVYVTYIVMTGNTHTMHSCIAIPKEDALAGDGPSLVNLQTFSDLEIDVFPATDGDPKKPADAPEILLNREFGNSFSKLNLYKITWSGKKASISKLQNIPLSKTYQSPNGSSLKNQATQPPPGGKLRADEGRRTLCVFAHGGSLFISNEAKQTVDSRCGIFWAEVRASDGELLQEALIDDPNCDYLAPTLAVDSNGNVGLGCARTSATEYPSVYVMMRAAGDLKNTMGPPVLAAKGTACYSAADPGKYGIGWGNYSATCIDPSDPAKIWTYQEYATSGIPDEYNTCWAAFKLK